MARLQINMRPIFLTAYLTLGTLLSCLANDSWETNTYPHIGLKLQSPSSWKADVSDQGRRWDLFAYPLVEHPVTDVQYRIVISAIKLSEKEHLRIYPKDTNPDNWMISQHMQTSQKTNGVWIYFRRDIFGNGFGYVCSGRIKRIQNQKSEDLKSVGGDEHQIMAEARRILDSIEILSTNSIAKP